MAMANPLLDIDVFFFPPETSIYTGFPTQPRLIAGGEYS